MAASGLARELGALRCVVTEANFNKSAVHLTFDFWLFDRGFLGRDP
jgi:hypothetical protein